MGSRPIEKCQNCGAQQPLVTEDHTICGYCGSILAERVKEAPAVVEEPEVKKPIVEPETASALNEQQSTDADKLANAGCGLFVLTLIVLLVIAIFRNDPAKHGGGSGIDSLTIDTATDQTQGSVDSVDAEVETAHGEVSVNGYGLLFKLTSVKIDVKTFKKLYKKARKINSNSGGDVFIYDSSSPRGDFAKATYLYLSNSIVDPEMYFVIRTPVDKWASFYQAVLVADGKELPYKTKFYKKRRNGVNIEYSSEQVPESALSTLIVLARAKSAVIKLTGLKTTQTIILTPTQQTAMLRQLSLYKGLILMYDEK